MQIQNMEERGYHFVSIAHSIYRNHESSLYGNELDTLFAVKIFEEMQMACLGAKK